MNIFFIKTIVVLLLFIFWFLYTKTSSWADWKNHDLLDQDPVYINAFSPKFTFHLYRLIFLLFSFILILLIFFGVPKEDEDPLFIYLPWILTIIVEFILNKYFRKKRPWYKNISQDTLEFLIKNREKIKSFQKQNKK
tara:strand:- start:854 stop:1264 length:411 start_codon:yes stop_codon:yes gene_type:complete